MALLVKITITFPKPAYSSGASQHALIGTKVDTRMEEPLKADKDSRSLSVQDALLLQDRRVNINDDPNDMPTKSSAGKK